MLTEGLANLVPNSPGVQALLGTPSSRSDGRNGYFPAVAPDEVTMPYIVAMQLSRTTVLSYAGVNQLQQARFRFSCYGSSYKTAKELVEQVKELFDGFVGVLSDGTSVENTLPVSEIDDVETELKATVYATHVDYYFWFLDIGSYSYATQATDTFNRANENPLSAVSWTVPPGGLGALQVLGGVCAASSTSSDCGEIYTGASYTADQFAKIQIGNLLTANDDVSVSVRQTGLAGYFLDVTGPYGPSAELALVYSPASGPDVTLGTYSGVPTGSVVLLIVVGSELSVLLNGVVVISAQDSNIINGTPGIGIAAEDSIANATILSFTTGNVVSNF